MLMVCAQSNAFPPIPLITSPSHPTNTKQNQQIQLQTTIPVIFGVLTCLDEGQAKSRSTGENNHGISWGKTAVEMALMRTAALSKAPERVGYCRVLGCVFDWIEWPRVEVID
jgi:hypothetical protein